MRSQFQDDLGDFLYQMLMHTDMTYIGSKVTANGTYRGFATKSHWQEFYIQPPPEGGLLRGEGNVVIWPWDIAAFIRDLPGNFISVLGSVPKLVKQFWESVDPAVTTQDSARQLRSDLLPELFRRLGTNERFQELRPVEARICRIIGGIERPTLAPIALPESPFLDDEVKDLILAIATHIGVFLGTAAAALGLLLTIVSTAIAVGAAFPPGAPLVAGVAVVLLFLVTAGWAVATLATIVSLVVNGILIFNPSSNEASALPPPALAAV